MLRKLSESILTIIVTVVLVVGAAAILFSHYAQDERHALAPLQEQNEALRSQIDENRRDVEATAQMLRQAVNHQSTLFSSDEELTRLSSQRLDALADAIANRVAPKMPAPKSAEELARQEEQQIDRISSATAQKLQPAIADLSDQQKNANGQQVVAAQAQAQQLRQNLASTQQAADDALRLTQQLSAMYLDTYKDHGALVRLFSLPADLIQDTASGSLVNGDHARKQEQQQLDAKIKEIEQRLNEIRTQAGANQPVVSNN
jgi:hypothetical protein